MYYVVVRSFSELLGEEGILRLPSYLPETFVFDDARRKAISDAVEYLIRGENVLIEGSPGTGKTALMFMVLRELSKKFGIGYIREGVTSIGNEHFASGIILFYDDLPRIHPDALRSIVKNKVRGLIATGRTEEVVLVKRIHGIDLYEYFRPIRIPPLSDEKIREMLLLYLDREAIKIADENAIDEVVKKACGLPVYVWQVARELKIRKQPLTLPFAKSIPQGMLDYVDDILWRLLGGKPERYEVLLTLLCMTDFARYAVHQDLFTYIYLVAKERRVKKRLSLEDIVMDVVVEDVGRYLAREGASYAFRLPHDSWADVLRGKSSGPMASEIAKINALYTKEKRNSIILSAARRAWWETVKDVEDLFRKEAFKSNVRMNLGEEALKDILEKLPKVEEKPPVKVVVSPKPVVEVRVMEGAPLDILRGHLARAKVISKKMLAGIMKISMGDLDSLLDIADFAVPSVRPGFVIYKDHYFRALKHAEELLSKMGVVGAKSLAEGVELFPEDIVRGLRDKVIVHGDKIFHRDYIQKLIKAEVDSQGYVDLRSVGDKHGIPLSVLKEFRPILEQQYIRSAEPYIYYDKEYYSTAVDKALRLLEERGIVDLIELSRESGLFKADIANALSGHAIVYGDKVFHREYVWRLLLREINTKNRICLSRLSIGIPYEVARVFRDSLKKVAVISPSGDCFYTERFIEQELVGSVKDKLESYNIVHVEELAEKLDVREEHIRSILNEMGIKSPTNPNTYYAKSFVEGVLKELVSNALSIDDVSRERGMPKSDLQEFLKRWGLEKEYSINRLRRLLGKDTDALLESEVMEIQQLISILNKYDLEPSEANVVGVANIVIWEVSGDETFFEKGVRILEKIDDRKARRNLAIAYAKYTVRLLESGADRRSVKNYVLLVRRYVRMQSKE